MTQHHDFDAIRARHPLVDVIARYTDVTRKGSEYVSHCLFHADSNPSMTIYRGRDGHQRYRCFACGAGQDGGDVIDFIRNIENVDTAEAIRRLDGEEMPMPNTRPPRELPPDESDCWEPIVPVPADAPAYDPARTFNPRRPTTDDGRVRWVRYQPAMRVEWRNADGDLIGHVLRLEFSDGEKICPVVTYCVGPGGERRWCAKRPRPPYPLVGVEELAARPSASVLLVEGEKKREAARAHLPGFVVLSLLGGAEAVKINDLTPLHGRNVTLWPDADPAGRRAMRQVAEMLS
jgi:hypothetical protein